MYQLKFINEQTFIVIGCNHTSKILHMFDWIKSEKVLIIKDFILNFLAVIQHYYYIMKYFKEATFSLKQKFGYTNEEQALKLFDQVYHYDSTILPINLLDSLSELSFQMYKICNCREHYPQIINQIIRQLSTTGVSPQDVQCINTKILRLLL
ncbi:hypothetical protein FGO68_gene6885 [Halteria grandinella]|uniref:Uncharacterized protein n=1 Tax=Halteria grandinella TaxID=5974 RepID=A0A8J8SYE3_HALGN|nr:hypothetical protein FGO68_gene6885 [Halteria grandinella]